MKQIGTSVLGRPLSVSNQVDNKRLIEVNKAIRQHPIETVGAYLREQMTNMKSLN
jgi:ketol-acid reductoisomerase